VLSKQTYEDQSVFLDSFVNSSLLSSSNAAQSDQDKANYKTKDISRFHNIPCSFIPKQASKLAKTKFFVIQEELTSEEKTARKYTCAERCSSDFDWIWAN